MLNLLEYQNKTQNIFYNKQKPILAQSNNILISSGCTSNKLTDYLFQAANLNNSLLSFTSSKKSDWMPFDNTLSSYYRFKPDEFQLEAAKSLYKGNSTIVTAPTGTGKTLVAEYATNLNIERGKKTIYTSPIKALANQKYSDFCKIFGPENVGIATGDREKNSNAPIVIMTTEVYRNKLISSLNIKKQNDLDNVGTVVFDEFHYMNDDHRGRIWEESIMFTPKHIQILPLSATVANSDEVSKWLSRLNNSKNVDLIKVPAEKRHVPLSYFAYIPKNEGARFIKLDKALNKDSLFENTKQHNKFKTFDDLNLIRTLSSNHMLPAIVFQFSKSSCTHSQNALLKALGNDSLIKQDDQSKVLKIIQEFKKKGKFLGVSLNENALCKGIAVHNAGIMPDYKELIETLFQNKLLKVVYSTETLAAGINMPAKTTVITSLQKPSGYISEGKMMWRDLTVSEFQQMAGRAGRRLIDTTGNVVVVANNNDDLLNAQYLYTSLPDKITSHFKPSYNLVINLLENSNDKHIIEDTIKKSFFWESLPENGQEKAFKNLREWFDVYKNILKERNYIQQDNKGNYEINLAGKLAANVRGYNELFITELLLSDILDDLSPAGLAALISTITTREKYPYELIGIKKNKIKKYEDQLASVTTNLTNLTNGNPVKLLYEYEKLHSTAQAVLKQVGFIDNELHRVNDQIYTLEHNAPTGNINSLQEKLLLNNSSKEKILNKQSFNNKESLLEYLKRLYLDPVLQKETLSTDRLKETKRTLHTKISKNHLSEQEIEDIKNKLARVNYELTLSKRKKSTQDKIFTFQKVLEEVEKFEEAEKALNYKIYVLEISLKKREKLTKEKQELDKLKNILTKNEERVKSAQRLIERQNKLFANIEGIQEKNDEPIILNNKLKRILNLADDLENYQNAIGNYKEDSEIAIDSSIGRHIYNWANASNTNLSQEWERVVRIAQKSGTINEEGTLYYAINNTVDLLRQIKQLYSILLKYSNEQNYEKILKRLYNTEEAIDKLDKIKDLEELNASDHPTSYKTVKSLNKDS